MDLDAFWAVVDAQLEELKSANSADDVLRILAKERDPYVTVLHREENASSNIPSAGFFAGGGGDGQVWASLLEAGWSFVWSEADYYWCMRAPNGDLISYVEGDVYRGNSRRLPRGEASS